MFIGHFALGLSAKKITPKPSLGTLFMAAQFIDLVWPVFILLGIERVEIDPGNTAFTPLNFIYYPFTHGLISVLIWGTLFGLVYYSIKKNFKVSVLLGLLVVSHWVLDLIVHRPDLPLIPGSDIKAGFGLWNSVPLTVFVEMSIFFLGLYFYVKTAAHLSKMKTIGLWSLVIFLLVIYVVNITSPPPPSTDAIGYAGLLMWLFVIWGYWIDKPNPKTGN